MNHPLALYHTVRFLGQSKLREFADFKMSVTLKLNFAPGKGRKHCGKKEKMLLPGFSLFPDNAFNCFKQYFQKRLLANDSSNTAKLMGLIAELNNTL